MKKLILSALFSLVSVSSYSAGIPVIDVTNLAQAVQTVAQLRSQLQQLQSMEATMTGSRGMGGLLNQPQLRQNLPQNGNVFDNTLGAIQGATQSVQNAESIGTNLGNELDQLENRKRQSAYQGKAMNQVAFNNAIQRLNNIEALARQIDYATDTKAAADLNNRLNAENMMVQSETQRIALMQSLQQNERTVIEQHQHDVNQKILDPNNTGMPNF